MSKIFDHGFYDLACTPTLAQRVKQNTLYTSLEGLSGESLSDIDLLYIMATDGTRVFSRINWVDPGDFSLTENGTLTFTEDEGFTGDGSTGYLDTGWNPTDDGVNFTLDESGVFVGINNECTSGNVYQFGVSEVSSQSVALAAKYIGGAAHRIGINSSTVSVASDGSSIGLFHVRRVADNDLRIFKNGSQVGSTSTQASTSMVAEQHLALLAFNANGTPAGYSDAQIGIFGIGASLTGQESALYTAWNTYFTSL